MVDVCYGTKEALVGIGNIIISYSLLASHKYLILGHTNVDISIAGGLMSCVLQISTGTVSNKSVQHVNSRTTMDSGGGASASIYVECITDCIVELRGYGYHAGEYNYEGYMIVIEL